MPFLLFQINTINVIEFFFFFNNDVSSFHDVNWLHAVLTSILKARHIILYFYLYMFVCVCVRDDTILCIHIAQSLNIAVGSVGLKRKRCGPVERKPRPEMSRVNGHLWLQTAILGLIKSYFICIHISRHLEIKQQTIPLTLQIIPFF